MTLATISLFILLITLFVQYKRYNLKALLHPSFWFLAMWILSVLSFKIFIIAGFEYLIISQSKLNELFIFVSFTSLCFIFWGSLSHKKVKKSKIKLNLFIPKIVFKYFSILFFLIAIFNLIISGFDVVEARHTATEATMEFFGAGGQYGIHQLIFNTAKMLNLPFTLFSGWYIGKKFFNNEKNIPWFFFLPLLTSILNTIAGGGRAGIISALIVFALGLFFALFSFEGEYKKKLLKTFKYALVVFIGFSVYTTFVSIVRTDHFRGTNPFFQAIEEYAFLKPFAGIMEYTVFHYQGYQFRRYDSMGPKPELGQTTFAFITTFNVPIISQIIGENISIQNIFDLKDVSPVRGTIQAIAKGIPAPTITSTVYFVLIKDFGFWGTLLMIFLFTGFSQYLFNRLFLKNNHGFWSIILFIAVYILWTLTFFSHHLSGAWFNTYLYPILIIEVLNNLYFKKERSNFYRFMNKNETNPKTISSR